jgi:flagellin-like hook-associated protein FlgL
MAQLARALVVSEAGLSVLAQANQAPYLVMELLR